MAISQEELLAATHDTKTAAILVQNMSIRHDTETKMYQTEQPVDGPEVTDPGMSLEDHVNFKVSHFNTHKMMIC